MNVCDVRASVPFLLFRYNRKTFLFLNELEVSIIYLTTWQPLAQTNFFVTHVTATAPYVSLTLRRDSLATARRSVTSRPNRIRDSEERRSCYPARDGKVCVRVYSSMRLWRCAREGLHKDDVSSRE